MLSKNNWRVFVGTVRCTEKLMMVCERLGSLIPWINAGTKLRSLLKAEHKRIKGTLRDKGGILSGNTLMH